MVSRGSSGEELPPDWKEHVKVTNGRKVKIYTHEVTGMKLYSKKRVWSFDHTFEGTSRPLSEQDQKSIPSKNEDDMMACQGTLHSLSEQDQSRITTRSKDKVQAFQGTSQSSSEVDPVVETDASLDWLPHGWFVESKVRKGGLSAGSTYKIYVDPSTGHKFNSKPKVMRYLECGKYVPEKRRVNQEVSVDKSYEQEAPRNIPTASRVNDDSQAGKMSSQEAPHAIPVKEKTATCVKDDSQAGKMPKVVSRSTGLDELPPGWVKELRARKGDPNKKDPYYIDPESGYEFRSKRDVLRYLSTGDMSTCAMKPQPGRNVDKSEHSIPAPARTSGKKLYVNPEIRTRTRSQCVQEELQNEQKKAPKRKPLSSPVRPSKRQLEAEPEVLPVSSERAIRAAVYKAIHGKVSSMMEDGFPHQLGSTDQPDGLIEAVQDKPEQAAEQVQNESPWLAFGGDSLADPCYEFAFKTLTGEIPFEDTLEFQSIFRQPAEAASTSTGLPAIGTPGSFQTDVPFQLDSVPENAPAEPESGSEAAEDSDTRVSP